MEEDLIIKQRTEKQTFLRTEIIEKGFNPSSFQNYVESLKPDGKPPKKYSKIMIYRFKY